MRTSIALAIATALVGATAASAQTTATPNLLEVENEAVIVPGFDITVDDFEDTDILDASGNRIGEIDEVLMTADAKVVAASMEVGGFLGIGEKEVVVPLERFTRVGDKLQLDLTKEQIKALPVWDD